MATERAHAAREKAAAHAKALAAAGNTTAANSTAANATASVSILGETQDAAAVALAITSGATGAANTSAASGAANASASVEGTPNAKEPAAPALLELSAATRGRAALAGLLHARVR